MDSYVDLEYKKYRGNYFSLICSSALSSSPIDHQYLEMQSIISTNFYKGSMIFTNHNELELTPPGSLPPTSTSFLHLILFLAVLRKSYVP
ncbi:unnamed protein product, partial [Brassica rapa subsp. narinosa]